ncbi:MAG: DUF1232 domain-containing protein [Alphaproteobacteria bacterium]|nr:DUF1232 domain-containing protein [Alphaproteobacteria bacterium]
MDTTRLPWWLLAAALVYDVMPLDLIPDAVPLVGLADDVGVTGMLLLAALVAWRRRRADAAGIEGT